jgi:hypothetical protein
MLNLVKDIFKTYNHYAGTSKNVIHYKPANGMMPDIPIKWAVSYGLLTSILMPSYRFTDHSCYEFYTVVECVEQQCRSTVIITESISRPWVYCELSTDAVLLKLMFC